MIRPTLQVTAIFHQYRMSARPSTEHLMCRNRTLPLVRDKAASAANQIRR
jgi:hypothetical protein